MAFLFSVFLRSDFSIKKNICTHASGGGGAGPPAFLDLLFCILIEETIFVGDDLFDAEMRSFCGFMACPSNSHYLMKKNSDLILNACSGYGCIQELFEYMVSKSMIKEPSKESVIRKDSSESVKY